MNIDKVLVASNKRIETLRKIQKNNALSPWAFGAALSTWLASATLDTIQPGATVNMVVGAAFVPAITAATFLLVKNGLHTKSVKNLENTIIEEGKDKEKRQATAFNATEKLNNKTKWGYTIGGIVVAGAGFQVIEAVVPSLGVALMKVALIVATSTAAYKLSTGAAEKAAKANEERFNLAQRIAKRHGVDINTTTDAKVATVKFK